MDTLAGLFAAAPLHFEGSPLYGRLGQVVAADERLLAIAAQARAGQIPSNLLWASVQYLLLCGVRHELAAWYPSVRGGGTADGDPGPAFTDFCLVHEAEIVDLMRHRLVQTNVVKRSAVLRAGMAAVARETGGPVTFVEVGCSAGVLLRFDEYRYEMAGRTWGRASSPVVVRTRWCGPGAPPDLGNVPVVADRVGIDLNPVDVTKTDERLWLRALIWPENTAHATLQDAALRTVAADPPPMVAGDVVDVLPEVVAGFPADRPVVVFHAATRLHVPAGRRERFDAVIADVACDRDLFHLSYEEASFTDEIGFALELRRDGGPGRVLAVGHGHGEWLAPPQGSEPPQKSGPRQGSED